MTLHVAGAIDMHCHFAEDTLGGRWDPETEEWAPNRLGGVPAYDVVREARATGHDAVVLKSHSFASPALAAALQDAVPDIDLYSGICTDHMTGGLNVYAVEAALAMGAKIVWLPTVHSVQEVTGSNFTGFTGEPVHVTDPDGELVPEVHEIFALLQQVGGVLATGHISAVDHYAVVQAFGRRGKVLVTHAGEQMAGPRLNATQCRELADLGATIELTALTCTPLEGFDVTSPEQVAAMIAAVGAERCTLGSDFGWAPMLPHPAAGYKSFLERLWECGVAEDDIVRMAKSTPARLLDRE